MRRGQVEGLEWLPRLLLMAVAVVVCVLLVRHYSDQTVDGSQLELSAYLYRLHYGDVITYVDKDTGRVYPGVIDVEKFTDERLDEVFGKKNGKYARIASCLSLRGPEFTKQICNQKATFDRYDPYAVAGVDAKLLDETWPVVIRDGQKETPGILHLQIVRPDV